MHLKKACRELWRLVTDGPNDTIKYAQVAALLAAFDEENHDALDGRLLDTYASEKITSVRTWFQILCGIGEDGAWTVEHLRQNLYSDISKLEMIVSENGLGLYTPAMAIADQRSRRESEQ